MLSRLGYGGAPSAEDVLEAGRQTWVKAGDDPERIRAADVTVTFGPDDDRGRLSALLRKYATGPIR